MNLKPLSLSGPAFKPIFRPSLEVAKTPAEPQDSLSGAELPPTVKFPSALAIKAPSPVLASKLEKPAETPVEQPSIEILREKLYAVHATDSFPKQGVLIAGAQHIDPKERGNEPASFRPTIHFALGEMVREHGRSSWEEKPYAIILPLRDLEPQLSNVAPHDSFIVGDLTLPPGSTILVPEGGEIGSLPDHISVKRYKGRLRDAVGQSIEDQGGWKVNMSGVSTDDPAKIGQRDINKPEFFSSLFKERPDLSFGSHIGSEQGEAFRFGVIEQSLVQLDRQMNKYGMPLSTGSAQFYRALIDHNLKRLKVPDHPAAQKSVQAKKDQIKGHLKLNDLDLKLRQQGLSLARSSEATQKLASKLSILGPLVGPILKSQLSLAEDGPATVGGLVEALKALPPAEVQEFQKQNPEVFKDVDPGVFQARYAVSRWLEQRVDKEGLESLVLEGLKTAQGPVKLLDGMEDYLREDSYRCDTALSILRKPVVAMNLAQEEGMLFSPGGPETLRSAIQAHPKARLGLEDWQPELPFGQEKSIELLSKIGEVEKIPAAQTISLRSCLSKASRQQFAQKRFDESLAEVRRPLNSVEHYSKLGPGDSLSLYQLIQRDGLKGLTLPPDAWNSSASLLDIYQAS